MKAYFFLTQPNMPTIRDFKHVQATQQGGFTRAAAPMMPITSEGRTAKETSSIILLPENDLLSASIFSNGNNDCGFIRVISLGEYISAIFFQRAVFIQLF
ncbi:hypothetical protein LNO81_11800 [Klebsiella variicola subsp. variicola]|nr:hypothetical protein [Klebsiella variicola subsp. variicola]